MGLSLITAPASEPISRALAKSHLRVETTAYDDEVDDVIEDARSYVETHTRRALVEQTWDYTLPRFPYASKKWPSGAIVIPKAPVISVSYVHYVNGSGSTVSYATSASPEVPYWEAITDGPRTVVIPKYNNSWPTFREHGNAVTVRFTAGYSTLPNDIRRALLLLIAHYWENRQPVVVGTTAANVPMTVEALLSPYILRGF